jgi:hypothetical protein
MFSETKRSRESRDERNVGEGAERRVYDVAADGYFYIQCMRTESAQLPLHSIGTLSNHRATRLYHRDDYTAGILVQ